MLPGTIENNNFHDLGIFERVPSSQDQLFLSLETPGYLKYSKSKPKSCLEALFYKSQKMEIERVEHVGMGAGQTKIRIDQKVLKS